MSCDDLSELGRLGAALPFLLAYSITLIKPAQPGIRRWMLSLPVIAFFALIMGSINKTLNEDNGAIDIIDDKIEEVDNWLLRLVSTRNDKTLPRPLYEKIKEFISSSLRRDFDMLIEDYDFFDQLKPSLRYRVV